MSPLRPGWLCTVMISVWKKKQSPKRYLHFDSPLSIDKCWKKITDPKYVKSHAFYPFIHYELKHVKYVQTQAHTKVKQIKKRDIFYCSHLDRYVYAYYGFQLNTCYDQKVKTLDIDNNCIAYRLNKGLNTVNYAYRALKFIYDSRRPCLIMVGDFTEFFDSLNHSYLKSKLQEVLGVERLERDWYGIFKSITQYCYIEREDLLQISGLSLDQRKGLISESGRNKIFENGSDFRQFKNLHLKKNKNDYGIPQGAPISAVLSNVYMLDFDLAMKRYVTNYQGQYYRYSDDFIIVIPLTNGDVFYQEQQRLSSYIQNEVNKVRNLKLHSNKCQFFLWDAHSTNKLKLRKQDGNKLLPGILQYLGFSFDV